MDLHVAIVGASLGGLSVANVLQQLGAKVGVFECFPQGFHSRGGALGAVDVDLVRKIRGDVGGRGHHHIKGHGHFYGDLWQYLYEGLKEGTVTFGIDVTGILEPSSKTPLLQLGDGPPRKFDLIVGADGGKSIIRPYVTSMVPSYAGYTVWRGLVPRDGIAGPPSGSATVRGCHYETLGFPCAGPEHIGTLWNCGIYMAMPETDVEAPTKNRQVKDGMKTVPDWFLPFVRHYLGDTNAKFWDECSKKGKVTPHPVWELAADSVVNARIVLLGDAAHMASPRTGAGAFTAMTDAVVLGASLQQGSTLEEALRMYNDSTVKRGQQLFERSRAAASYFAPASLKPISPAKLLQEDLQQGSQDAESGGSFMNRLWKSVK